MLMEKSLRKGRRSLRPGTRGFTLIEVLVVVAIIALLVSILLPSLSSARRESKRVVCMTALKQVHTGLVTYLQTASRDRIPDADTLGGWWFRYGAGERSDQYANPETLGMPALLSRFRCLPGKTNVWMCPDTPADRAKFKNSYAWGMFTTTRQKVGGAKGELEEDPNSIWRIPYSTLRTRRDNRVARPWWVWDNWRFNAPVPTGARYKKPIADPDNPSTDTSGDSYLKIPDKEQYYPHSVPNSLFYYGKNTGDKAQFLNVLRFDGSIMRWNPKAGL
jgi:prepilin-type N-terminal cleavage/methylation domain-containing protein